MRRILLIITVLLCVSCQETSKKGAAVFEDFIDSVENDYDSNDNVVAIPFNVKEGVKVVPVTINDLIGVDMIIDTGCSGAMISLSEARYLVEKGSLTIDDVIGEGQSKIADGSIVENMFVRLKKITIGDELTATDVVATVSNSISAPLLLGNEVLDRVKTIAIDNENQLILFLLR